MIWLAVFALALVVVHEAGHVLATLWCGGRWRGVVCHHGWAVGVFVDLTGLSRRQQQLTLVAPVVLEGAVLGLACVLCPTAWRWWTAITLGQWLTNWLPWWGLPTDGRRLWELVRTGRPPKQ